MNAEIEKKIVTGIEVGDKVAVWYDGRTDQKMYGVVTRNDDKMCEINRTDVDKAVMYTRRRGKLYTVKEEHTLKIYIFGDMAADTARNFAGVNVEKI